jgi:hypothetical protein
MHRDQVPAEQARRITPRALCVYARALGLKKLEGVNGTIAVYHRAEARAEQIIVPLDEQLDDYAEMVAGAVVRLAEWERRPIREILDHLLLPPADLLHFQDSGPHAADGTLPLLQAVELVAGVRKALLAQAHSVLQPRPFHPRLSRHEAEQFVGACRFGQTRRGSFTVVVACPLEAVPTEASLFEQQPPFTRQVTASFMRALARLADAAEQDHADALLSADTFPVLSANLCEALIQMRPLGDRPALTVSAVWSRAALPPAEEQVPTRVSLHEEVFALAEYLAPRLRSTPQPRRDRFVGFVDVLRGQPGPDNRPAGEVMVTLFQDDELIKAWLDLPADVYETANQAHMTNSPVGFEGVLNRSPRVGRVVQVSNFRLIHPVPNGPGSPAGTGAATPGPGQRPA